MCKTCAQHGKCYSLVSAICLSYMVDPIIKRVFLYYPDCSTVWYCSLGVLVL